MQRLQLTRFREHFSFSSYSQRRLFSVLKIQSFIKSVLEIFLNYKNEINPSLFKNTTFKIIILTNKTACQCIKYLRPTSHLLQRPDIEPVLKSLKQANDLKLAKLTLSSGYKL